MDARGYIGLIVMVALASLTSLDRRPLRIHLKSQLITRIISIITPLINEKELVYNVDTRSTYTVKSHLIAEDGKWMLYDLLQSPYAWTNINGQDYVVIIDSVTEAEQNNQQIYEMTVKFRISQPTSL